MAARDNVLFGAAVTQGATAGTVIPLSLVYGIENVRQGYGTPKLKNVRAFYSGIHTTNSELFGVPIEIKNSNWVDGAGLIAQKFLNETTLNNDNLAYMRGRDKILQPNTTWTINAVLRHPATNAGYVWVLLEIEYSDVPGINAEGAAGSPVMKKCSTASVTAAARTPITIGSFDNLLQGVTYVMSEVSVYGLDAEGAFLIVEGFGNQKGLTRIIPAKSNGMVDQLEGSVYLTKQTYNLAVINYSSLSAQAVDVYLEMIASAN